MKQKLIALGMIVGTFMLVAFLEKIYTPKTITGTTIGTYHKTGTPIDITYALSNPIEPGMRVDVDIQLFTEITDGNMVVDISLDEGLFISGTFQPKQYFTLNPNRIYKLHFYIIVDPSSDRNALHHIHLLAKIKNQGFMSFAVPIISGDGPSNKAPLERDYRDNPISSSNAEEKIIDQAGTTF
ncbi:MAG: hypothetical protein LGB71_05345 [Sulfurovum sp.]|nr:hypothetical protein [Sulfurovum sp.]MCB4754438.1 hypothetical protein [Sulfurovum sp.]MCB4758847.1 hypothetical protein [Sulfurovum sp.]MCB4760939.1 hypothetical protein [Sulfurovum sp.]MCB4763625.1 hypothetical protein [Sulfurovum sp.]